jgi:hypothetical protein
MRKTYSLSAITRENCTLTVIKVHTLFQISTGNETHIASIKLTNCCRPQHHEHHGGRGRGFSYSDVAIETALMVKGIFNLSLCEVEGFLNSLFTLMSAIKIKRLRFYQ